MISPRIRNIFLLAAAAFLLGSCIIADTAEYEEEDYQAPLLYPFFSGLSATTLASPEDGKTLNTTALIFNFDSGGAEYFRILVAENPLTQTDNIITNPKEIVAEWNSLFSGSPGYLQTSDFREVVAGTATSNSYSFGNGTYFWLVIGFVKDGDLSHSSEQWSFHVQ